MNMGDEQRSWFGWIGRSISRIWRGSSSSGETGNADRRAGPERWVVVDLRGATISGGNVVGYAQNPSQAYYNATASTASDERRMEATATRRPSHFHREREEDTENRAEVEECRRWSRWMSVLDELEDTLEDPSVSEQLLEQLSGLTEEEKALVRSAGNDDRVTALLVVLRRRKDLEAEVRTGVRQVGLSLSEKEEDVERMPKSISTVLYETRLRMALKDLRHMNSLPNSTLVALRDVGCLSQPEYRLIEEGKPLTALLLNHHTHQLHLLCAVLRRRHPNIYEKLSTLFVRTQLSTVGDYHHNVPKPPQPCVQRATHEAEVRRWMRARARAEPSPSMLLLYGIGGGGKSYMAAKAACEALVCGFHRVLWIDAICGHLEMLRVTALHLSLPENVYLGSSEEILKGKLRSRMEELRKLGERILLVIDDAINDNDLTIIPRYDAVLVTSRVRTIGRNSKGMKSRCIEGLLPVETEDLLTRLLTLDTRAALQVSPGMWEALLDVCAGGFHMPLTVKVVGGLVQREQERWEISGVEYLEDMKERLLALRERLNRKPIRQRANVYAAIYLSIERLSAADRDSFHRLAVFDRGEAISPITMATVWSEAETEANDRLKDFVACGLLSDCGYRYCSRSNLFVLHDLIHDLLRGIISYEQRLQFTRDVVTAYSWHLSSVDPADVFFSLRYVGLCLMTGQAEEAASCLCRLSYVMGRIETRTTDGLLLDFAATCDRLPKNKRLKSFQQLMATWLPIAVERDDTDVLLRAAVARHHEEAFPQAQQMIAAERRRDRLFLTLDCPREGEIGLRTGLCDPVTGKTDEKREVLSLRWEKSLRDFVVVDVVKNDGIFRVHSLFHRQLLLEGCTDGCDRASSGGRSVVLYYLGRTRLKELHISYNRASIARTMTLELPDDLKVVDVCHSIGRDDVYAICRRDGDDSLHLVRRDSGRMKSIMSLAKNKWISRLSRVLRPKTRFWICDEYQVFMLFFENEAEMWSLGGIPLKRFLNVEGIRLGVDGRRIAVWRRNASNTPLTMTSSSTPFLKKKDSPEPVRPHWQQDDAYFSSTLIVFDLSVSDVVFSTSEDEVTSVCFAPDNKIVFLTKTAVRVASTTGASETMEVTRSRLWSFSGVSLESLQSEDTFGLCSLKNANAQLLYCSADSLLVQTSDGILRIEMKNFDVTLLWEWRFVDEEWQPPTRQLWAVDPRNVAIAFVFKKPWPYLPLCKDMFHVLLREI